MFASYSHRSGVQHTVLLLIKGKGRLWVLLHQGANVTAWCHNLETPGRWFRIGEMLSGG